MTAAVWWRCPLWKCGHGRVLHDGDGIDEPFTCCAPGCDCIGLEDSDPTCVCSEDDVDHACTVPCPPGWRIPRSDP